MNRVITGSVVGGQQLGRTLGYPTANLTLSPEQKIENGVWAARVSVDAKTYAALGYVGYKPTVSQGTGRVLEVHLLDFSGDLYGRTISVELVRFVRAEERFDSTEKLLRQIDQDKQEIIKILASCG